MQGAVGQRGAEIEVVPRQHSSFADLPAIRWFLELIQNPFLRSRYHEPQVILIPKP